VPAIARHPSRLCDAASRVCGVLVTGSFGTRTQSGAMKKKPRSGDGAQQQPPADEPAAAVHAGDPRFAAVHSNPRFARFPKARSAAARKHSCGSSRWPPRSAGQVARGNRPALLGRVRRPEVQAADGGGQARPRHRSEVRCDGSGPRLCRRSRRGCWRSGSAPTTCDAFTACLKRTLPKPRCALSRRRQHGSCAQPPLPCARHRKPLKRRRRRATTMPAAATSAKSKAQLLPAKAPAVASAARFLCRRAPATKVRLERVCASACAALVADTRLLRRVCAC